MDSIDLSHFPDAVNGFLASLSQTGSDVGNQLSSFGNYVQVKLPSTLSKVFKVRSDPPPPPPRGISECISNFIIERKRTIIVVALSVATAAGVYYVANARKATKAQRRARHSKQHRRLARHASNGGRCEVVLIAGSPKEPLVRLIAQDMNIRGFIVYITASPTEEECVLKENSEDIRPLRLSSYFEPDAIGVGMREMNKILETPVTAFSGAVPHYLSLAGVVIVPDLFYPSGPLETIPPNQWAQTVQSKIQMPLNILASGGLDLTRRQQSRIILVTPVIIGSLSPAFHAAESMVYGALSALALSLSRELSSQRIPFTHMRLGSFDTRQLKLPSPSPSETPSYAFPTNGPPSSSDKQVRNKMQADILSWPDAMRRLYGGQYKASAFLLSNQTRGSSLRALHYSLYDALTAPNPPRVVRVGRGSRVYDWLAKCVPESFITLLLKANEGAC